MGQPYTYVQTIMSNEEAESIDAHVKKLSDRSVADGGEKISKREWMREILLKEVRKDDEPLQLH